MISIALLAVTCLMPPDLAATDAPEEKDPSAIRKLNLTITFVELDIRKSVPPSTKQDAKQQPIFDRPQVKDYEAFQTLLKKSKVRTKRTLSGDIKLGSLFELKIEDYCVTFSARGAVFPSKDPSPRTPVDDQVVYAEVDIHWLEQFMSLVPLPGQAPTPKSKQDAKCRQELTVGKTVLFDGGGRSWRMSGDEWMHIYSVLLMRVDDAK